MKCCCNQIRLNFTDIFTLARIKCCYNQIRLNFTDILAIIAKEGLFYRLPLQPVFHRRNNKCFATGRTYVSYIIDLNHMLH